ncbi:Aminopeptidase [Chitinispirillum alkaliphilum]|nr:Aminopeptidase [Chitinispirillum alkaliphilum]
MTLRIHLLKEQLEEHNCTHALITDCIDIEYISGFKSSNVILLVSESKSVLFSDFRYKSAAHKFCSKNPEWEFMLIDKENFGFLSQHIPKGSSVGIQTNVITVDQYRDLRKACRGVKFVKFSQQINSLSLQKTQTEIKHMEKAARIADSAFSEVLNRIEEGMSEMQLAKILERLCDDFGSEGPSFETIVLFGKRAALPHGKPGKQKLKKGDFILFDFGCSVNGYKSDMSRTIVAGKASPKQKEIYHIVYTAQSMARKSVEAGKRCKSIDLSARKIITDAGYGETFGHATGHGIGLRVHENPRINSTNKLILQTNTVITIEPGIYVDTLGGVRIEDMVAVSNKGSKLLTHSPRELTELDL